MNREDKIINLAKKLHSRQNGNRIRQVVRAAAKAYQSNPEQLKEYFNHDENLLAGIATSAYHRITGDLNPCQEIKYGGLGVIIDNSEEGLSLTPREEERWTSKGLLTTK